MKIALQYSGMIRTFKKCYLQILETLKEHDVDVFVSFWDIPGTSLKHSKKTINVFPELEYKNIDEKLIRKEFPELNLKIIDIEKYSKSEEIMNKYQNKLRFKKIIPQREFTSQYYKIHRCNKLRKEYQKKNNIKYDWFIRTRPDACFNKIPNLEIIKEPIFFLNKYVWECPYYLTFNKNQDTNENIWMTNNEELLDKICNLLFDIDKVWNRNIYGENLLGKYIIKTGVIKFIKTFDFKLKILRSHGHYQIAGVLRTKDFE
jgi:hypothetical protein